MATWFTIIYEGEPTEADFARVSELAAQGFTSGQLVNDPEPEPDLVLPMWVYLDRERRPMTETVLCGQHEADREAYAEMSDQRLNVHDWNGKPRVAYDDSPELACTVCGYTQANAEPDDTDCGRLDEADPS